MDMRARGVVYVSQTTVASLADFGGGRRVFVALSRLKTMSENLHGIRCCTYIYGYRVSIHSVMHVTCRWQIRPACTR